MHALCAGKHARTGRHNITYLLDRTTRKVDDKRAAARPTSCAWKPNQTARAASVRAQPPPRPFSHTSPTAAAARGLSYTTSTPPRPPGDVHDHDVLLPAIRRVVHDDARAGCCIGDEESAGEGRNFRMVAVTHLSRFRSWRWRRHPRWPPLA